MEFLAVSYKIRRNNLMDKNVFQNFRKEVLKAIKEKRTNGMFLDSLFEIEYLSVGKMLHGTTIYYNGEMFNLVGNKIL